MFIQLPFSKFRVQFCWNNVMKNIFFGLVVLSLVLPARADIVTTPIRTFEGHSDYVNSVAYSPDGQKALSGSSDGTMKLWDISTGQLIRTFIGHSGYISSVAYSPDGQRGLSGGGDLESNSSEMKLWNLSTGEIIRTFTGHSSYVDSVAYSPDGQRALSGAFSPDSTMKLWDISTGELIHSFMGGELIKVFDHYESWIVTSVAFSPNGQMALSGGSHFDSSYELLFTGEMFLWNLSTGELIRSFKGYSEGARSVAFSPDGQTALSGYQGGTIKLWNLSTGEVIYTFDRGYVGVAWRTSKGHSRAVRSIVFSPDGQMALSGSHDRTIKLWNLSTGQLIRSFEGHSGFVRSVAFSPDGQTALSGSDDNTMKLWDLGLATDHPFDNDVSENNTPSLNINSSDFDSLTTDCGDNPCGHVGDPVDTATGAQVIDYTLLNVQGVLPISFSLSYNSLLLQEGKAGIGWGLNSINASLKEIDNSTIKIHWSANQFNEFAKDANGEYRSDISTVRLDKVVKNPNGSFTLTRKNKTIYEFSAAGQLTQLRNPRGQVLVFEYDDAGELAKIVEPISGVFLQYAYNAEGLLETVTDSLGRQVKLGYDSNRYLTTLTNANGETTTFAYNDKGQILTATLQNGTLLFSNTYDEQKRVKTQDDGIEGNQLLTLSYDESQANKFITTVTDRMGKTRVYTYNDDYKLLTLQDEQGNIIVTNTYNPDGTLATFTDANGNTTQFAYNNNGNLTTSTDAKGNATQMVYDDNSNLLSVTDALGKTTTFTYDANNNRISATNALGNTTRYTYNSDGQVLTATNPSNAVTTYEYEKGLPVRITNPQGHTQTSRYDVAGRLISTTDAEGHTTTFTYDGVNRLVSVTDALNRTVSMTYDSRDNLLTSTDAKGNVTRRSYDGNGNLISQINALAQETRYEYDGESRLIKVIDAKSYVTQLGYDAKGRLISTTDALGNTQQLSYDAADNLLAEIDALGKTVATYRYDVLNNPISVTNALGHKTQSAYDALSRLTRVTDPLNWATQFNYDNSDRLVASVDAKGGQSRQAFDTDGNLTSLTDANRHQTTFQFDNNGRLVEETSASGGSVRYTYNARDLQTAVTNARGQKREFEYDAVGRITRLTDPDGTVSYTYDPNDNVLTVTDASGTISREYDALDRVVKYTDSQGNTLQYAYDVVSNLVTLTYPDGKQVSYEYDANDQLTQVTDWAGRETRYAYDANGRLVEVVRSNGTQMTYTYDVVGQLVQQKDVASGGTVIRQFDFVYDAAGDIVKEQVVPEPTFFPFIPATMTYTAANRLATYNGEAVTFDADGNMTLGPLNGGLVTFAFDSRNRLSNVGDMAYRYDTENQRIAVSVAGQETRYVINSQAVLSQTLVRTAADSTQTFYVYGLGLIGEEIGGVYQVYHFDLRGSTVALSDAAGNVVEQFQYSPFGGLVSHNPTEVDTPFLYNGRDGVMTDDTGLYYMRARFYNPETRQFVNRDVLLGGVADGQSLNRFAYVTGEPVSFVDPFGLKTEHYTLFEFGAGGSEEQEGFFINYAFVRDDQGNWDIHITEAAGGVYGSDLHLTIFGGYTETNATNIFQTEGMGRISEISTPLSPFVRGMVKGTNYEGVTNSCDISFPGTMSITDMKTRTISMKKEGLKLIKEVKNMYNFLKKQFDDIINTVGKPAHCYYTNKCD